MSPEITTNATTAPCLNPKYLRFPSTVKPATTLVREGVGIGLRVYSSGYDKITTGIITTTVNIGELPVVFSPDMTDLPISDRNIFEDDPEILAMTDEELTSAALSLFGSWADREDIGDDWLDEIRSHWHDHWEDRYGPDQELSV